MQVKTKRAVVFISIVALALIAGILIGIGWDLYERLVMPDKYRAIVSKYSALYDIPEEIIFSVIQVESNFQISAKSHAGAMGLMQIIPSTFEWLTSKAHLNENLLTVALYDPEVNIRYGTYYLSYLAKKFDYDWTVVSAAYNAGEGRVLAWLESGEYTDDNGDLIKIPIKETKAYVKKINDAIDTYTKLYPELT